MRQELAQQDKFTLKLVNDMNLAYLSGYYRIGDYSAVSASFRPC